MITVTFALGGRDRRDRLTSARTVTSPVTAGPYSRRRRSSPRLPVRALAMAARRAGMTEADVLDLAMARSAGRSMFTVRLGAGGVPPS